MEVALELTRLYPDDPEVLYHSGRLFSNYAYLQTMRLAEVAPDSVWMHQAAGEANESQGYYDAALEEYREGARPARRDGPAIHYRIGRVAPGAGPPPSLGGRMPRPQAAREFEQELRIDPTNADAAYELGEMRAQGGRAREGARAVRDAPSSTIPTSSKARIGLGRVLDRAGASPSSRCRTSQKAVALNPEDDVAYYQLARPPRSRDEAGQGEGAGGVPAPAAASKRERSVATCSRPHVGDTAGAGRRT